MRPSVKTVGLLIISFTLTQANLENVISRLFNKDLTGQGKPVILVLDRENSAEHGSFVPSSFNHNDLEEKRYKSNEPKNYNWNKHRNFNRKDEYRNSNRETTQRYRYRTEKIHWNEKHANYDRQYKNDDRNDGPYKSGDRHDRYYRPKYYRAKGAYGGIRHNQEDSYNREANRDSDYWLDRGQKRKPRQRFRSRYGPKHRLDDYDVPRKWQKQDDETYDEYDKETNNIYREQQRSPIVKTLLRMSRELRCGAKTLCSDECESKSNKPHDCHDECEEKFPCNNENNVKREKKNDDCDDKSCDLSDAICGGESCETDKKLSTKGIPEDEENDVGCKNCKDKDKY